MVDTGYDHVLTDDEYKLSMGQGYVFFEITEPEELAFTYKVQDYFKNNQLINHERSALHAIFLQKVFYYHLTDTCCISYPFRGLVLQLHLQILLT